MSREELSNEEDMRRAVKQGLGESSIPAHVQAKLDETYASLGSIPQDRSEPTQVSSGQQETSPRPCPRPAARQGAVHAVKGGKRVVKRGAMVAAAAVLVVLMGCTAFAASRLLQMQPGEAAFFGTGSNLPVYNSLQDGVSSLQADVGDTVDVGGVKVTLDSVSSDRNIVNLFFTLEKEGGFDLDEQSLYEGSQENEWSRLQMLAPHFTYTLTSNGESLGNGGVNLLDAYLEDGKVKVMQRIVPEATLPDQVDIALEGGARWMPNFEDGSNRFSMGVGLDLSTVEQPRELGAQDLSFSTGEGEKTMGIMRFTASELGCVMVVRNDNVWMGEPDEEGSSYGPAEGVLSPHSLKVTDDQGNVLVPVGAGDGSGMSVEGSQVIEFANLSPEARSVTFTPMMQTEAAKKGSGPGNDQEAIAARKALNEANEQHVDVTQIGAQLPTSEYGGWELTGWDVADGTVSITLKPYGWQAMGGYMELIAEDDGVTLLESTWTDPATGETGTGYHSAIMWCKRDYLTGEFMQMVSYYAANDDELRAVTDYRYHAAFGQYREETDAAQTLAF